MQVHSASSPINDEQSPIIFGDAAVLCGVIHNPRHTACGLHIIWQTVALVATALMPSLRADQSVSAPVGTTVTISVTADGAEPFTYQWQKNGNIISGATNTSLVLANAQLSDTGAYRAVVANSQGNTTSDTAHVFIGTAPTITLEPAPSQTVFAFSGVNFTVTATGIPTPTFQWRKNGVNIAGATNATYSIPSAVVADAGTYSVVVSNGIPPAATSNDAVLIVNKVSQTITFDPLPAKTYGNPAFSLNASASSGLPVSYGSSNTAVAAISGTTVAIAGAGTSTITASQGGNANYLAAADVLQTLAVSTAGLAVTADAKSRAYGGANPMFTVTISGFVNGQTLVTSGVTGTAAFATTANATSPVGIYSITPSAGTLNAANYSFSTFTSGTLTVTPASLTVTADPKNRPYGTANPALTATISAFVNGETLATSGVTGAASLSTTATAASAAGPHPITPTIGSLAATNYSFSFTPGTLTISAAPLTVVADDKTRTYGAANPAFTGVLTGFVNGETLATSGVSGSAAFTTTATAGSSVGTYSIVPGVGSLTATNYNFATFTPGTLTVTPAPLTVTADSKSKTTGEPNPALTATLTGFVNGETLATSGVTGSAALSTTATTASPAGAYPITATIGSLNAANYSFSTFVAGTLTVAAPISPPPNMAPSITVQPLSQSAPAGATVTLTVGASGTPSPTFQWRRDGTLIPGATGSTYTVASLTAADAGTYTAVATNAAGIATSNGATLTIATAPTIVTHPQSQTALSGQTVTLSVSAAGTSPISYQWRKNGASISGATGNSFTLTNLKSGDAGAYEVVVTNAAGSVTSNPAVLIVNAPNYLGEYFGRLTNGGSWALYVRADNTATFIAYLKHRSTGIVVDLTINADGTFSVVTTENEAQTSADDADIVGDSSHSIHRAAAAATVTLSGTIANGEVSGQLSGIGESFSGVKDTGTGSPSRGLFKAVALGPTTGTTYAIVGPSGQALVLTIIPGMIDGATGTVASNGNLTAATDRGAQLAVTLNAAAQTITEDYTPAGATTPIRFAGVADSTPAASYLANLSVRSAAGTGDNTLIAGFVVAGGAKSLLIRAIGPSLANFGVSEALDDPTVSLYSGSTLVNSNDDWNTNTNAADIAAVSTRVGAFGLTSTSRDAALLATLAPGAYSVHVVGKGTAAGIALAELYDAATGNSRLVNASARTLVGTGANVLIAGFSISGNTPKQVLVRGIGPGLTRFGVANVLTDPQVELFQGQTALQQNDNWGGGATLTTAFGRVAAFALDAGSRDASLLVTLSPGTYSAVISGVGGTVGVALVEVYEMP